jgi:TRAP-type C4-dicarboxylate transport system substrate-binding protein
LIQLSHVAAAMLTCIASAAYAQALPAGPKVSIAAVTQPAPNLPQYTQVDIPLLREGLKAKSGGRIEVTLATWPERNVSGPEVLRLVRSGQVEIATSPLTTVSGDVPLLDGADLAGMNQNVAQARKVAEALVPAANKELEKLGIRIVATFPYTGQTFFCRKPVLSLADLSGLKVRVPGPSGGDLVKALGGIPVSLAFGEVYTALERGTLDCALTGAGSANAVKFTEVTTHMMTQPLFWATSAYYVNLAWWNKLDPAVRTFIEGQLKAVQAAQWTLGAEVTQDGIDCNIGNAAACKIHTLVKEKPMTLVQASSADKQKLSEALSSTVLPNWVKRCGAKCGEVYNEVIAPISGVKYVAK